VKETVLYPSLVKGFSKAGKMAETPYLQDKFRDVGKEKMFSYTLVFIQGT
jgi:hypothetical protein